VCGQKVCRWSRPFHNMPYLGLGKVMESSTFSPISFSSFVHHGLGIDAPGSPPVFKLRFYTKSHFFNSILFFASSLLRHHFFLPNDIGISPQTTHPLYNDLQRRTHGNSFQALLASPTSITQIYWHHLPASPKSTSITYQHHLNLLTSLASITQIY
jgi:hypothetical protein